MAAIIDRASIARTSSQMVRTPGVRTMQLGQERYTLQADGMLALPIYRDDKIEIIDAEGLQSALLVAFDDEGHCVTNSVGLNTQHSGERLSQMLLRPRSGTEKLKQQLVRHNIDLTMSKACEVLHGDTPADSRYEFTAEATALLLIAAPPRSESVFGSFLLPSNLVVMIYRARPEEMATNQELPDPLADISQDIRVKARTAQSFEVKEGEYFEVIDVSGRQCSDLQLFGAAKLDKGVERMLDVTSTRSVVGSAYPGPGLYSKFYDVDFEPMVEVVRDSCGRHDSFGVACTSKYYDDMGYFGHINCSDNFNKELKKYDITSRKSWMAMNIFFNTFFDDARQFGFDDPWSRPGDSVLFRATKDLVCVSSACPCDIDPANGWAPSDIHVRTYSEKNVFKRSIAFRKTTDSEPEMTKETGFHSCTEKLTSNFTEYNGYWLANSFNNLGPIKEYWACRENAIITDLSPLRKYDVLGPDAEILMQTCVTRDMRKLAVGQVVYTAMCYESGGMIDDGTVFRLGKDNFRWIGGCDSSGLWLRTQAKELGLHAWVKDVTDTLNNVQVQGPKSREILKDLIWTRPDQTSIEDLGWFRFSIARLGDEHGTPVLVSRTGYTGELGYEVFCHPDAAPEVWDTIWKAGEPHNMKPLGLEALDLLRVEAGLIFAGYEFCDQTDPYEAGIGFTVPLKSKEENFIGKEALKRRSQSPQKKLVGLQLMGEELAENGDGVFVGRQQVGEITSGVYSAILKKNIALCRVFVDYAELGTEIEVGKLDGHQKRIPAEVVAFPHFDPKKERVRDIVSL